MKDILDASVDGEVLRNLYEIYNYEIQAIMSIKPISTAKRYSLRRRKSRDADLPLRKIVTIFGKMCISPPWYLSFKCPRARDTRDTLEISPKSRFKYQKGRRVSHIEGLCLKLQSLALTSSALN